ncbi:hypothetical protein [Alteraurantiacibacter aquimixticola]|uniref:DUF8021 domain-containing protein n=1 Tax=Alteraurantiacibacter aquimixticola TaxID=2489173 RepID=A0A4V6UGC6_9SPHN|nr:hypothetical protein [Alteraurantiacibacter aquimixticola]TIX51967.1 hypothetical protein E5222_05920 [Alteraurantiacibacter aquimixticola]
MPRRLAAMVSAMGLAACSTAPETCDRECLIALTDDYVAALVTHDASDLPLADNLIFVENLQRSDLTQGLWRNAQGGPTDFAIHVPDAARQTVGWLGMLEANGEPTMVAIRLRLEGGEIVEAEHLIAAIGEENLSRVQTVRPGLLAEIPEGSRLPDGRLIDIGASYYDALDENDGSLAPFAEDCQRHENGFVAAGPEAPPSFEDYSDTPIAADCKGQLDSQVMTYIERIENRRVFAADPVTGLVMGFSQFRHPMDFGSYDITAMDGSTVTFTEENFPFEPFDLPAAHIFKVGPEGQIHEIEAMGFLAPLDAPTGWE